MSDDATSSRANWHPGDPVFTSTGKRAKQSPASTDSDDDGWRTSSDPSNALADECLASAMPRDVLRAIMRGDPVAVVVCVPGPDWVQPIADAVTTLNRGIDVHARDGSRRSDHSPTRGNAVVAQQLRTGVPVIGVSQSPLAYLPSTLTATADASVTVNAPAALVLRRVLARCGCRPVPRVIPAQPCAGLSFDEVCAAIRKDSTGRDVLDALTRMRARKAAPIDDGIPTLDRLPGLSGEARQWAEKLALDWKRWKTGVIPYVALDAAIAIAGPPGVGKTMLGRALARSLAYLFMRRRSAVGSRPRTGRSGA